jgi:hypothetical protein
MRETSGVPLFILSSTCIWTCFIRGSRWGGGGGGGGGRFWKSVNGKILVF